jgi:hypothetical protein
MRELKKYWQAMATALENVRANDEQVTASRVRVDIAGCRVMAPPVRQQQGASYIPRTSTATLSEGIAERIAERIERSQGGKQYAPYAPCQKDATRESASPNQGAAFHEFFAAALPLADDVLFIPIAPATAPASDVPAHQVERGTMARFV